MIGILKATSPIVILLKRAVNFQHTLRVPKICYLYPRRRPWAIAWVEFLDPLSPCDHVRMCMGQFSELYLVSCRPAALYWAWE